MTATFTRPDISMLGERFLTSEDKSDMLERALTFCTDIHDADAIYETLCMFGLSVADFGADAVGRAIETERERRGPPVLTSREGTI